MDPLMRRTLSRAAKAGIIAAVAFIAALGVAVPASHAQNNDQEMIAEIVRKAIGKEAESGFCATTGWRLETPETHDTNIVIYDTGIVGSSKTFFNRARGQTDYCAYLRIMEVFSEGGRRCVRVHIWSCSVGKTCAFTKFKGCRASDTWKWTSER